ncbi:MAG: hypothetical protein J6S43_03890 [Lentisphaeria bacterium]|nr:hypothetical protein [Lentisphaeria bacterium]
MKKSLYLFLFAVLTCSAADKLNVSFARGKWDQNLFQFVKSPRFAMNGAIIQQDDHIVNRVPDNLTEKQLLSSPDAYCALLTKDKFSGNITISSKMSFDHLMAPLIVIAPELGRSADGKNPELRDHYEIVIFYQGINVWHHRYINGQPSWYKLAYMRTELKPKTVYDLQVTLRHTKKGVQMIIKCNGKEFGCAMPVEFTAKDYFAGIIACEGVNRFYDFRIQ